jgi:hypothetical protein
VCIIYDNVRNILPILVAAQPKAWVCDRSLAGIVCSNPGGTWMSLVSAVFCQVEVSVAGW